jgi:NADP-dependent 3-hydroxy acid dehydrogenase YdfG
VAPVALVTGASSGIGSALARLLAAEGHAVGLLARREDRLRALADAIHDAGGRALAVRADVRDRAAVAEAVRAVVSGLGSVDLLVLNAGTSVPTDPLALSAEAIRTEVEVNLMGAVHALEAVIPSMRARGRGHVAAISSLAGWRGLPGAAGYCATKAALTTLIESFRLDWHAAGIRTTIVHPGFVRSELTDRLTHPLPFLMDAEKAARRIARAIRRRRKRCDFPWPMVLVAGLASRAPDFVLRFVHRRAERRGREAP